MTGRTEPPDLMRHLAQLERRVEQIERANRTKRTTRPTPVVGNELLLGDAGQDQIHAHTHDGDGYIHFLADGEQFHGNLYQATSGTKGTTRQAEVVLVSSRLNTFVPQIRLKSDSDDGTLPSRVLIDAGNGRVDIEAATGGAYIFNRNIPVMRGAGGLNVSNTKFFIQCDSTVVDTDASGNATIAFPSVFPTGLVTVVVSNGDQSPAGGIINSQVKTASQFQVHVRRHDGTIFDGLVRCDWIAVGY